MANAYFIKNYQIGYNLKRSSKSLLLPYILVCVVTAMLCVNINDDMSTNYRVFGARILDMIGGISKKANYFHGLSRFGWSGLLYVYLQPE